MVGQSWPDPLLHFRCMQEILSHGRFVILLQFLSTQKQKILSNSSVPVWQLYITKGSPPRPRPIPPRCYGATAETRDRIWKNEKSDVCSSNVFWVKFINIFSRARRINIQMCLNSSFYSTVFLLTCSFCTSPVSLVADWWELCRRSCSSTWYIPSASSDCNLSTAPIRGARSLPATCAVRALTRPQPGGWARIVDTDLPLALTIHKDTEKENTKSIRLCQERIRIWRFMLLC